MNRQAALAEKKPRIEAWTRKPSVLIVIPAFNEEDCIARVLEDILDLDTECHVLVINDGSKDATGGIIREVMRDRPRLFSLHIPNNIGIGGAVQAGFMFARRNGYTRVVQVDGDGQHRADQLKRILEPLVRDEADIVIGSRFLPGCEPAGPGSAPSLWRALGIRFFTTLLGMVTGRKVTDPTSGFRAFGRAAIEFLAEHYAEDYPEPESIITLHRRNYRMVEVPVIMNRRSGGRSSISPLRSTYYMVKVTIAILMDLVRRPDARAPERSHSR